MTIASILLGMLFKKVFYYDTIGATQLIRHLNTRILSLEHLLNKTLSLVGITTSWKPSSTVNFTETSNVMRSYSSPISFRLLKRQFRKILYWCWELVHFSNI